jgi:uncharacterized sporulation protein YeaH/YhbH (DUF444 family)
MALQIDSDVERFRQIVRGHARKNLRKYMGNGELIGRQGDHLVKIPIPEIHLPYFRFGKHQPGVGQGDGEEGDVIGIGDSDGEGGQAGDAAGKHIIEVEFTIEELAQLLGEELELPRIQPKQNSTVVGEVTKYTGMRRVGPEALKYFKRTYREALRRMVCTGEYDFRNPKVVPIRDDKRYRSWREYPRPENNAVVFFVRDFSGSMGPTKTEIVRLICYWLDIWLQVHYKNLIRHYVLHETFAREVDYDKFYSVGRGGGTKISTGLQLCNDIIRDRYDPEGWNLYIFYFGDGENWGGDDDKCKPLIESELLPVLNMFCYGEVQPKTIYGLPYSDTFIKLINKIDADNILSTQVTNNDDVYTAIKIFLGKGL